MKMVERMARALIDADAWPIGRGEAGQELARHLALAALEAMREPTPAMADAGNHIQHRLLAAEYKRMIDAAIKEAESE